MASTIFKLLLIRDNERQSVLYFFILYTVLGCGIAFGRNSTDVLFFKRYGVEYLPLMYVAFSLCLALVSIIYAAYTDRIAPEKLSTIIFSTLIGLLLLNWAWISFSESKVAYPAYFILYECASEILIVHSAHYIAQNFNPLQAKRLFPIVMAGTQVGIILGSIFIVITAAHINTQDILIAWSLFLVLNILMLSSWHKKVGGSTYFRSLHKRKNSLRESLSQIGIGLGLIKRSRMLLASSFALFFMVITFYILSYSVNLIYTRTFTSEAELSRFFAILSASANGLALILQIFITSRVIHKLGVKKVNLFFPLTSIVSFIGLFSSFSLIPAIIGSLNKDTIMPAFRNPVRTIFFSTLPNNIQGRARAISVVIVLPLALFVCGLLLIALQNIGDERYFLSLGILTALAYLYSNIRMNREYVNEILSTLRAKILIPHDKSKEEASKSEEIKPEQLNASAQLRPDSATMKLFNMLVDLRPYKAHKLIALRTNHQESNLADQIIHMLRPLNPIGFSELLWELYEEKHDNHLKATILTTLLLRHDHNAQKQIYRLMQQQDPRLQVTAIIGALHRHKPRLRMKAIESWRKLLNSSNTDYLLAALDLLEYLYLTSDSNNLLLERYKHIIIEFLESGEKRKIKKSLSALEYWPDSQFLEVAEALNKAYDESNSKTRILCVKSCHLTYLSDQRILQKAIEDSNQLVRTEAARTHFEMAGSDSKDIFKIWLSTDANGSPLAQKAYLELFHEISNNDDEFEEIAMVKAKLAQHFYLAHQILQQEKANRTAAFLLVNYILEERIKQYIELSVYAVQGCENTESNSILTNCINSRDKKHQAYACEVLQSFRNEKLGQILSDLIDNKPIKYSKLKDPKFSETITSILEWCRTLPDPWLSQCAKQALTTPV